MAAHDVVVRLIHAHALRGTIVARHGAGSLTVLLRSVRTAPPQPQGNRLAVAAVQPTGRLIRRQRGVAVSRLPLLQEARSARRSVRQAVVAEEASLHHAAGAYGDADDIDRTKNV